MAGCESVRLRACLIARGGCLVWSVNCLFVRMIACLLVCLLVWLFACLIVCPCACAFADLVV